MEIQQCRMKQSYLTKTAFTFFIFSFSLSAYCQNLEDFSLKKGIKTNGSVNLTAIGYGISGIPARRDPFIWYASGNLNVNLFGYSAPLSFSYSNGNSSYSQPFNQFRFNPQYKWVKVYLGYSSLNFSPYTLAGHVFSGIGAELSPGKWRLAFMYGRLKKAVPFTTDSASGYNANNASFRRMGYGIKIGYEAAAWSLGMSLFSAKDDLSSIPFVLYNSSLAPQQNVAASLNGRTLLFKHISIEGEYAVSNLNTDTRNPSDTLPAPAGANLLRGLLPQSATSRYFDALRAAVGYQGALLSVSVRYERIAPEYATLGAYYFNNDMENITLAPTVQLFKNKLSLSANAGLQRNNLDNTRTSTTKRWVGNLNVAFNPNEKWSFSGTYSNFSSYTNLRPQTDPFLQRTALDTLNFYQVTGSTSGTASYNFGNKEKRQTVFFTGTYQQMNDKSGSTAGSNLSGFYSGNLAYSMSLTPQSLTLSTAFSYNRSQTTGAAASASRFWGPTLSISKSLLEKTLRASLSSSYNVSASETGDTQTRPSDVLNNRLTLAYNPKPSKAAATPSASASSPGIRHSFSLSFNVLQRFKGTPSQPGFTEATANLNYAFSF